MLSRNQVWLLAATGDLQVTLTLAAEDMTPFSKPLNMHIVYIHITYIS